MNLRTIIYLVVGGVLCWQITAAADWKPVPGHLMTKWAEKVNPANPLPEYPRPQMVRKDWVNLNGLWDYAIRGKDEAAPTAFDGKILVPFPVESALSGVKKPVGPANRLWYRRTFTAPSLAKGNRLLLHFDAVDWHATVTLNNKPLGEHKGGYDPFTFDITDNLRGGDNELIVSVWDPTDTGFQPRGKQVLKPGGIMYTAVSGIWQTVWLETVPAQSIEGLLIVPDLDKSTVSVTVRSSGGTRSVASVEALDAGKVVATGKGTAGKPIVLKIRQPKLWSPDTPFLYDLKVKLGTDEVASYFGMRKISLGRDEAGILRLMLNNKFVFQLGPLDQGWWPDGLYTAPTDEALRYDIEATKQFGMNLIRKHVKVEPPRWYYHCDKLGMLVWQDMPSGNNKGEDGQKNFETELKQMIDAHRNCPCIIMWVPFNEGWGQFDTERVVQWIKEYDPSRLVNEASGWTNKGSGDVRDIHSYPGPGMPPLEEKRAAVLGEFGGLGLPVSGHTWQDEKNWGYRSYETADALFAAYDRLNARLHPLIGRGLNAAVYTQTTDCEVEVNGLMTYDRAVIKMGAERTAASNRQLSLPPPTLKQLVAASDTAAQEWGYTTNKPADGWQKTDFDDSGWQKGSGGFGTEGTPGTTVRTKWDSADIWIRRTFKLDSANVANPQLWIHHDEDAEVYINGVEACRLSAYTTEYESAPLSNEARQALRQGDNVIAIHCHQTRGGQYIDAGMVDVIPAKP